MSAAQDPPLPVVLADFSAMPTGVSVCDVCGKVLKSSAPEALASHKRESSKCIAAPSRGEASSDVRKAEAELAEVMTMGQNLHGSFEEIEQHLARRREAELSVKRARSESKAQKVAIKEMAAASMSAANWTASVASAISGESEGSSSRFSKGECSLEGRFATETVGLLGATAFREKREALEREAEKELDRKAQAEHEADVQRVKRKQDKKRKREAKEKRGLSFAVDEDEDG